MLIEESEVLDWKALPLMRLEWKMAVQERKKEVSIPLPMEGIRTRTMELHPSSIECITWNRKIHH